MYFNTNYVIFIKSNAKDKILYVYNTIYYNTSVFRIHILDICIKNTALAD